MPTVMVGRLPRPDQEGGLTSGLGDRLHLALPFYPSPSRMTLRHFGLLQYQPDYSGP